MAGVSFIDSRYDEVGLEDLESRDLNKDFVVPTKVCSIEDIVDDCPDDFSCMVSIEISQILCNFEDALGKGSMFRLQTTSESPLVRFRRSVMKVIEKSRLWISQMVLHNVTAGIFASCHSKMAGDSIQSQMPSSMMTSTSRILGASKTREDVLKSVQEERDYWENIAAAHRHASKVDTLSQASPWATSDGTSQSGIASLPPLGSVSKPDGFTTLGSCSPRIWPYDIRTNFGLAGRPGTTEGVQRSHHYLDLLLESQECASARNSKSAPADGSRAANMNVQTAPTPRRRSNGYSEVEASRLNEDMLANTGQIHDKYWLADHDTFGHNRRAPQSQASQANASVVKALFRSQRSNDILESRLSTTTPRLSPESEGKPVNNSGTDDERPKDYLESPIRASTAIGSERHRRDLFTKLPPVFHMVGNPLRRPGQARILTESTPDRILGEYFDEELSEPQENEANSEVQYYRNCKEMNILPTKMRFLAHGHLDEVDLSARGLTDDQFQALSQPLISHATSLRMLDLSWNSLLSHTSLRPTLDKLAAKQTALRVLRLSGLTFRTNTVESLVRLMKGASHLQDICFQSSEFPASSWSKLCKGFMGVKRLERIDLSNTQCGRWQQTACYSVAQILGEHPALQQADLSGNYFRREGLRYLGNVLSGHICHLRGLWLDDNACAEGVADNGVVGGASHPMVFFCEMLRLNTSLRWLSLRRVGLSVMAGYCLEDAMPDHPELREVYLSDNALGQEGFRAVLRGMLKGRSSKLEFVDVSFREGVAKPSVSFNYSDLTESYIGDHALNLELPYHRSLLRLILRRAEDFNLPIATCLQHLTVDGRAPDKQPFKKERSGFWQVPSAGKVEFQLVLPAPTGAETGEELIEKWQRVRRLPVATARFVHFHRTLASMESDFEVCAIIEMIARDCLLRIAHLKILTEAVSEIRPKLVPIILPHLVLAIPKVDRACINSALLSVAFNHPIPARRLQELTLRRLKEISRFNAGNPNGRYKLELGNPMQYSIAERILTINAWEAERSQRMKRVDSSQVGSFNAIRNFSVDGEWKQHDIGWELPGDGYVGAGFLSFDYVSLILPTAKSKPLNEDLFEHIVSLLRCEGTDASESARYCALNLVSHRMVLTARQLAKILETFVDSSYRADLYCGLYCRCCEFGPPLVDTYKGVLGDQPGCHLFTWMERGYITERIGLINTIDWMNLQYDPHRGAQRAGHRPGVFDTLKVSPRNRYTFNLECRDDHMLATMILKLSQMERDGLSLANWSENKDIKWTIPKEWTTEGIPRIGTFQVTYSFLKNTTANTRQRQVFGSDCGWTVDKIKESKETAGSKRKATEKVNICPG